MNKKTKSMNWRSYGVQIIKLKKNKDIKKSKIEKVDKNIEIRRNCKTKLENNILV